MKVYRCKDDIMMEYQSLRNDLWEARFCDNPEKTLEQVHKEMDLFEKQHPEVEQWYMEEKQLKINDSY